MPSIEVTAAPDVERAITESWLARHKRSVVYTLTDKDRLFTDSLRDAYDDAEAFTHRSLLGQTLTVVFDSLEAGNPLWLPRPPVRSITSVTTYDSDDNATVVASSNYRLEGATPSSAYVLAPRLVAVGSGWHLSRPIAAVKVVYTCGYGDAAAGEHASVPRRFVRAILRRAATFTHVPMEVTVGTVTTTTESMESILQTSVYTPPS